MPKIVIDRQALVELVREVMENSAMGDVFEPKLDSTKVSAEVDPNASATNPGNSDYSPQNRTEFDLAIRNLAKTVPDEKIADLYKSVQDTITSDKKSSSSSEDDDDEGDSAMKKNHLKTQAEAAIRKEVRNILSEIMPSANYDYMGVDYYGDAHSDEDEEEMRQMAKAAKKGKSTKAYKQTALGSMADVEGASFAEIAQELGFSVAGAKQAVDKALEKARFAASEYSEGEDLEILVLQTMVEYIDKLASTGELTAADKQLMLDHPDIVRDLDGFREFLDKKVRRFRKQRAKGE